MTAPDRNPLQTPGPPGDRPKHPSRHPRRAPEPRCEENAAPEYPDIPQRILALYEDPRYRLDTWADVARALRLPAGRGSAHSLAHGLKQPDPRLLHQLTVVEFRALLPRAVANLRRLIGRQPLPRSTFTRRAHHKETAHPER